jgi:uncharacterized protein YjdB
MHQRTLVQACVATAVIGCGSDGGTGPRAAALHILPAADTIGVGETLQLRAVVLDAAGDTLRAETVTWLIAPPGIATLSNGGLVRGMTGGVATVTASVQGATDDAQILVAVPGASVTIQGAPADSLWLGGTVQLFATVRGPAGELPNLDTAVTWTSGDTTVATVSTAGLVTARYGGAAPIMAATPRALTSVTIAVRFPVHTVTIAPDTTTILPGESTRFTAALTDTNGVTITGRPVTWASSDSSVATASALGVARALRRGVSWIRATSETRVDSARLVVEPVVFRSVGAGSLDACGLSADSLAYCWGQIGHPYKIPSPPRPSALFVGSYDLCANAADSTTTCWQYDYARAAPIAIPGNRRLRHVSIEATICGIAGDTTAWCWIGNGTALGPRQVSGGLRFKDVSTAALHACGVATDGVAYCWQGLGDGDSGSTTAPTPVMGVPPFAAIGAGSAFACALDLEGAAWCWGVNSPTPTPVPGGNVYVSLDAEHDRVCGITVSGAAYCWAGASPGAVPQLVPGGLSWVSVSVGQYLACGLTTDGAYCWGQAGPVPMKVPGQD